MSKITEIQIGCEYEMVFPFQKEVYKATSGNSLFAAREGSYIWLAGCEVDYEDDGSMHTNSRYFTARGEGKVIYKVLSFAEMPGRYLNRIIFKRWLIDPDGKKYNAGEVRMLTEKAFYKDINSRTPFRVDYELED